MAFLPGRFPPQHHRRLGHPCLLHQAPGAWSNSRSLLVDRLTVSFFPSFALWQLWSYHGRRKAEKRATNRRLVWTPANRSSGLLIQGIFWVPFSASYLCHHRAKYAKKKNVDCVSFLGNFASHRPMDRENPGEDGQRGLVLFPWSLYLPHRLLFFLCWLLLDVEGVVSGLAVQNIFTQTRTHITQHTTHGFLLRLDQRNSARSLSLSVWGWTRFGGRIKVWEQSHRNWSLSTNAQEHDPLLVESVVGCTHPTTQQKRKREKRGEQPTERRQN